MVLCRSHIGPRMLINMALASCRQHYSLHSQGQHTGLSAPPCGTGKSANNAAGGRHPANCGRILKEHVMPLPNRWINLPCVLLALLAVPFASASAARKPAAHAAAHGPAAQPAAKPSTVDPVDAAAKTLDSLGDK